MERSVVVVATYNERENISTVCDSILSTSCDVDVLIVDDNSPDGTGEIADQLAACKPRVHVLHRARKEGLAFALWDGFVWALEREYDLIFNLDGDLSHNPVDIPRLGNACANADVVIGSRYIHGIRVINWSPRRLLLSLMAAEYVRLLTRLPVYDPTSGFRCFRHGALREILGHGFLSRGYSFHIELVHRAWKLGMVIVEIPILYTDREYGLTKLSSGIIMEAVWIPWRLLLHSKCRQRNVKLRDSEEKVYFKGA